MILDRRFAATVALLLCAADSCRGGMRLQSPIVLGVGTRFADVPPAVSSALGVPVITDRVNPDSAAEIPPELRESLEKDPLGAVSQAFDLEITRRPDRVVFARRFSSPEEPVVLAREELAGMAGDLYRLLHPFNPKPIDITSITDQRDFTKSLSDEQRDQMRGPGLPIAALRPEQRELWLTINASHAYGNADMAFGRLASLFREWGRAKLSRSRGPAGEETLEVTFRNPASPGGETSIATLARPLAPAKLPVRPAVATRDDVSAGLPSGFQRTIELPEGPVTVKEVARAVETRLGIQINIPSYGKDRRVIVFPRKIGAGPLLRGIAEIYGWQFKADYGKRYFLGRPAITAAKDGMDLNRKLNQSVPPALWSLISRSPRDRVEWQTHQVGRIVNSAAKSQGRDWTTATLGNLDSETQETVAQLFAVELIYGPRAVFGTRDGPRFTAVAPERGVFHWADPRQSRIGPTAPLITFRVPRPTGGHDYWGWAVGTSTLDQREAGTLPMPPRER